MIGYVIIVFKSVVCFQLDGRSINSNKYSRNTSKLLKEKLIKMTPKRNKNFREIGEINFEK